MKTGELIKRRRKQLGLNADYVAEKLGVSRSTIFRYENGDIEKLPLSILEPLADVLLTTPAYFMGWNDQEPGHAQDESSFLLMYYNKLNDVGKKEAINRVKELTEIQRYTSELKVVARNGSQTTHCYTEADIKDQQEVIKNQYPELICTKKSEIF